MHGFASFCSCFDTVGGCEYWYEVLVTGYQLWVSVGPSVPQINVMCRVRGT